MAWLYPPRATPAYRLNKLERIQRYWRMMAWMKAAQESRERNWVPVKWIIRQQAVEIYGEPKT